MGETKPGRNWMSHGSGRLFIEESGQCLEIVTDLGLKLPPLPGALHSCHSSSERMARDPARGARRLYI
jgi:hypothetical protein